MLLNSTIKKHQAYHEQIEKDIKSLFNQRKIIEEYESFTFPGVKGADRALIKLKESIMDFKISDKNNKRRKFKLETLKDLTRGSFVFKNSSQLKKFLENFKQSIEKNPKFKIYQVKNMFKNKDEDKKYDYKDIKLILGYEANPGVWLTMEYQFILLPILKLKQIEHKFYDISRSDFSAQRNELLNLLIKMQNERDYNDHEHD